MSKAAIVVLVFILYCIGAEYAYLCPISEQDTPFCSNSQSDEKATVSIERAAPPSQPEIPLAPIMFNWDNPTAVKTDKFTEVFRQNILDGNSPNTILEITGFYHPSEVNNTNSENLGFARAASIAALFPNIPFDTLSRRVNQPSTDPGQLFEFAELKWVARPSKTSSDNDTKIITLEDRQIAYFSFNSTTEISNGVLNDYIKNLAEKLKSFGGTVSLTGHTDDVGEEEANEALGRQRANSIKKKLITYGVPSSQITVASMGEKEAQASNSTEQGRARNRRVEIVLSN